MAVVRSARGLRPHPLRPLEPRAGAGPVAVLGAGHGGLALAGYLAARGVPVRLWNRSPAPLAAVEAQGGILLEVPEEDGPVRVRPRRVSCDLGEVVRGAEAILVAVPASAHRELARRLAGHLQDGQAVLLLPGRTGGALEFVRELDAAGCSARVLVGEAQTFPFASRTLGPGVAAILGVKRTVPVAALPARRTPELIALFRPLLPMLEPAPSVLHTSLENMGAVLHPAITLLNAGRIEAGPGFRFYAEGVTPGVARAVATVDGERLAVARAFGTPVRSLLEWLRDAYGGAPPDPWGEEPAGGLAEAWGAEAAALQAALARNPAYADILAPLSLDHRYLWEDVPTGLVPLAALGAAAGVETPAISGLVHLAASLHGRDYAAQGRTLARMGLSGLGPDEILTFVMEGSVAGCATA
ncbi:MAG: NAD/NADP octopine/nopaline dehydrogenase family protein [Firmicutes bacterium]|nr:NAD/NADP octopine/nopaline dehydrogenase family protein [Bacillota bacterium]